MIRILFFGRLSDLSPSLEMALPSGVRSINALIDYLGRSDSELAQGLGAEENLIILNEEISAPAASLRDGDEIAFTAPLSGG